MHHIRRVARFIADERAGIRSIVWGIREAMGRGAEAIGRMRQAIGKIVRAP
jgi:hypothetical protein